VAGAAAAQHDDQHQAYQHRIDRIELDLASGDITLTPGSAGQVVVRRGLRWDSTKPTVTEQWNGNTLHITTRCASGERNCATNYDIEVPRDVTLAAKTDAGNVTIRGIQGSQDLRTDAGNVSVEQSGGALTLHTNSGRITGTGLATTHIDSGTDAGNISLTLTVVPDSLTARSSAGDIDLHVPKAGAGGYGVQATTDAGTRRVTVDTSGPSKHRIVSASDSGDVTVRYAL
jgi:hypothetical protein